MMGLAVAEERNSLGTADYFCINLPDYIGHKRRRCYLYPTPGHPGRITAKRSTEMNNPDAKGRMCATHLPRRKIRKQIPRDLSLTVVLDGGWDWISVAGSDQ